MLYGAPVYDMLQSSFDFFHTFCSFDGELFFCEVLTEYCSASRRLGTFQGFSRAVGSVTDAFVKDGSREGIEDFLQQLDVFQTLMYEINGFKENDILKFC